MSYKILDTNSMNAGKTMRDAVKSAILLDYKFFRFNGLVYDLDGNRITNLK